MASDATLPPSSSSSSSSASASASPSAPPPSRPTVTQLLAQPKEDILKVLGGIYEDSPWVAREFLSGLENNDNANAATTAPPPPPPPPSCIGELHARLSHIVNEASHETQVALLQAHPDLCEKIEKMPSLSTFSQDEQARAGLQNLTLAEHDLFTKTNARYRQKFGFPFILAVRHATKFTVLSSLQARVSNTPSLEFFTAMEQVHKIAWMRLLAALQVDDKDAGFLTCHVLDTAHGIPAANMRVTLHRLSPPERAGWVGEYRTNQEGRLEGGAALKGAKDFIVGTYEWTFYVHDYFASTTRATTTTTTTGIPFLDTIPLRFGIDNPEAHYHVPLLVSPWSYSTYRGS